MRKGENIRQRKDGRWEARYFDTEEKKYKSVYAKNYSEAKRKREQVLKSSYNQLPKIVTNVQTVKLSAIEWLESNKSLYSKQSTYVNYYDKVFNHIIPDFPKGLGNIKLTELTQKHIDNFIVYKLAKGRLDGNGGLNTKTVKDICVVLNQILSENNLNFKYKIYIEAKEVEALNSNEYQHLIMYLLLDTDREKMSFLIALVCGLRIGELCALQNKDIDYDNATITVTKTLQRIKNPDKNSSKKTILIITEPKSLKSKREIPVPKFLMEILTRFKESSEDYLTTGNKKCTEPRSLDRKFKSHLSKCCMNENKFHVLRHTFASKCIENGMDYKTLSDLLGHTNIQFTLSKYVHSDIDFKRKQMEKVAFRI